MDKNDEFFPLYTIVYIFRLQHVRPYMHAMIGLTGYGFKEVVCAEVKLKRLKFVPGPGADPRSEVRGVAGVC